MQHVLPSLPFAKDALAPHISAETFDYHYGKHHAAYVDNLNKMVKDTEFESASLEDIMLKAKGPLYNNAAQHWNHSFFWNCMRPKQDPALDEGFMLLINKSFGSLGELKIRFTQEARSLFGSGWVWLVDNGDEGLSVMPTSNAANPLTSGKKPLLVIDVWEHAYYIDYRNQRAEYIEAFWPLINWDFVMRNHTGLR